MMTTVSAIVGTLPIAIGVGTSAASRRPLGIAVVGGLAFSQIVTLYVTPVFYTYFDELQSWLGRRANRRSGGRAAPRACRRGLTLVARRGSRHSDLIRARTGAQLYSRRVNS